jgi:uncharacterized membrane protein
MRGFVLAVILVLLPVEARANLNFCNNTGHNLQIAIGYEDTDSNQWVSEGWFSLGGGQCGIAIAGNLTKRYYYYTAEDDHGDLWTGDYSFCVSENSFTIIGDSNCEERGYTRRGFRVMDTSQYTDWTQSLND